MRPFRNRPSDSKRGIISSQGKDWAGHGFTLARTGASPLRQNVALVRPHTLQRHCHGKLKPLAEGLGIGEEAKRVLNASFERLGR